MGFDCVSCGEREIWAFECLPNECTNCFKKKYPKYGNDSDEEIHEMCIEIYEKVVKENGITKISNEELTKLMIKEIK